MSTKPTRQQDQACQKLAQALLLIAEAARLDGRDSLGGGRWLEVARDVVDEQPADFRQQLRVAADARQNRRVGVGRRLLGVAYRTTSSAASRTSAEPAR